MDKARGGEKKNGQNGQTGDDDNAVRGGAVRGADQSGQARAGGEGEAQDALTMHYLDWDKQVIADIVFEKK